MFGDIAKQALEFLKLGPCKLVALCLACAFLLFGGKALLQPLGVYNLAQNYRSWLGLIFVVAASLLLAKSFAGISHRFRAWRQRRQRINEMYCTIERLDEAEKQVLRYYVAEQSMTNVLSTEDGVADSLEAKGIIYRSRKWVGFPEGVPFEITSAAWDCLKKYPFLLKGSTNTYRTDLIRRRS